MADYMANANRNMEGRRIDLNIATAEDLERISDIGAGYAPKNVAERERRGGFNRIDDLDPVPGIGPETVKQLRASTRIGERENSDAR